MGTDIVPAKILIIEDDPGDVRLLRYALDQHGEPYTLQVLRDGEEALHFIQEQRAIPAHEEPCVIVLDLHLPRHNGVAVLQAIRQEPALAHVKVAVMTTLASPDEELLVRNLDVQLYRKKPFALDGFISLAGEILALCRQHSIKTAAGNGT